MNSLYIRGYNTSAGLSDRRAVIKHYDFESKESKTSYVPIFNIARVIAIGYPKITTQLLHHLMYNKIPIYYLSSTGNWISSMQPRTKGNAFRRIRQYEASLNEELCLKISKLLINNKIHNMRRVLQRLAGNRQLSDSSEQKKINKAMQAYLEKTNTCTNLDSLRGLEGIASAKYFQRLAEFFPKELPFTSRSRRPPKDAANALLSWTYAIISAEIDNAIRCAELDPCIGFLHKLDYGRPSLALDLLEVLRAPLADRLTLKLLNTKMLTAENFEINQQNNGVYLKSDSKKIFFNEYEKYMERLFTIKSQENRINFRQIITQMVMNICHVIENKELKNFFLMP